MRAFGMMGAVVAMAAAFAVGGCARLSPELAALNIQGAQAADKILADAEFVMCRGITVGAWTRRYGRDEQKAGAWKTICGGSPLVTLP